MSLDFELVNQSCLYSKNKLGQLKKTASPHLFLLEDFLNPLLVQKLVDFVANDNINWKNNLYNKNAYPLSRQQLNWLPDTVVEEVHMVFSDLTLTLNSLLNKSGDFSGISIWRDTAGFGIPRHTDNPSISYAIQIYLVDGPQYLTTVFEYNDEKIQPEFKINSGYLMDNQSKLVHYIEGAVPQDFVRYSVYAIWTLT